MSQQHRDVLAANWDPEILAAYMAKVQNDDSDDAMSSDDDSDSEVEFEEELSTMTDIEMPRPDDIASDDSAFSSEDEFAEKEIIETQTMRREVHNQSISACVPNLNEASPSLFSGDRLP